jgi:hypothetical protein
MTTEERLDRIESTLGRIAESHLELETSQVSLLHSQTKLTDTMKAFVDETREWRSDFEQKLNALVEHEQVLDSKLATLTDKMDGLAEAQHATDGKLNVLIQAQIETEHKLQRWIDRSGTGHAEER